MVAKVNPKSGRVLVIERLLDAPRELVFEVWTRAEHIANWWGPKDFTVPYSQMDARPGGRYRACIRSPEGVSYWMRGVFSEVVAPERLVFTWAWEDENGSPGHETLVSVRLEDHDGKTKFTFTQAVFESVEQRDSHREGWNECFNRLEAYLAQTRGSKNLRVQT